MAATQVIIGIPGQWKNRTELIQTVASQSGGYLMAGQVIHNAKKNIGFQVVVYEYDSNLKDAFSYASRGVFEERLLDDIEQHTFTIYVIADVNSFEDLKELVEVGGALLNAGGLAVKVEVSGLAHSKEDWYHLADNLDYFSVYSHFVTLIGDEESYYSCGMKAFGLPDVMVPSFISPEEATDLLNNFNLYTITEEPSFRNGETFSLEEDSSLYILQFYNDFRYEEEHTFFNPHGLFELVPS